MASISDSPKAETPALDPLASLPPESRQLLHPRENASFADEATPIDTKYYSLVACPGGWIDTLYYLTLFSFIKGGRRNSIRSDPQTEAGGVTTSPHVSIDDLDAQHRRA